ncbi:hypothetical protein CVT25_003324 [Psilocybe cyanescens]|uniref:Uncharacterized protein n=1 Tax=Psilocybe cyanescens TaxID=93625 RepID=A0A409WMT1_PSICY|nr:hypothetical protein CVT25_003324 [Psilocybe cyanescens]
MFLLSEYMDVVSFPSRLELRIIQHPSVIPTASASSVEYSSSGPSWYRRVWRGLSRPASYSTAEAPTMPSVLDPSVYIRVNALSFFSYLKLT